MIAYLKKTSARIFSLANLVMTADRVGKFGCLLPLAHFVVLPFGVFFYVIGQILGGAADTLPSEGHLSIRIPVSAVYGFYWLLVFWALAIGAVIIVFSMYKLVTRIFSDRPFEKALAKCLLAFIATSGTLERLIGQTVMPTLVRGTNLKLSPADAPKFGISLYSDLGEMVRSSYLNLGSYSYTARYSMVPLTGVGLLTLAYVYLRIAREVRVATRGR